MDARYSVSSIARQSSSDTNMAEFIVPGLKQHNSSFVLENVLLATNFDFGYKLMPFDIDCPGENMNKAGIEKVNIYGGSLCMMMSELALARGMAPDVLHNEYLVHTRSMIPLYEDVVTMAVNAASPLLSDTDKGQIGLLIFGTEGGPDYCKPASTHIHQALGLPSNVRNFEIKCACYTGMAALDYALNWIASGLHHGRKALVIASDFSRKHFGEREEYALGGAAAAVLVSDAPKVIGFDLGQTGIWTSNLYDFYRPDARREISDGALSLLAYLDALEGAYADYVTVTGASFSLEERFRYLIYHMPFPGMALRAHLTLLDSEGEKNRVEALDDFDKKVRPSLHYASQVGSNYGASNFIALCGLIDANRDKICSGDRIGFFSYGSGCIGQFSSGIVLPEAVETVASMKIQEELDARHRISVSEYETLEAIRDETAGVEEFSPPLDIPADCYNAHYRDKKKLILKKISQFQRFYEWS